MHDSKIFIHMFDMIIKNIVWVCQYDYDYLISFTSTYLLDLYKVNSVENMLKTSIFEWCLWNMVKLNR